jgi:predicted metal-dependent enzyme (double-stranded beta helix superfamily)
MSVVLPTRDLGGLAEWYAADPASWPVQPRFETTDRWYARLALTGDHEAWLLTWLPGQATELHDHGGASGAFTVLQGRLTEQIPTGVPQVSLASRGYGTGATRPFGAHHIHRIVNDSDAPAVSVHVYAPALARMTRYELTDGELRVSHVEQAGEDW